MSVDETARKILEMPDDAQFYLARHLSGLGGTLQGFGNNGMIADLQAMAKFWLLKSDILRQLTSTDADNEMLELASTIEALEANERQ